MTTEPTAVRGRRVVLFAPYPHVIGGMERVTEVLATELPATGWEPVVVAPSEGRFVDRLRRTGVEVVVVPAPPALLRYGGRPRRHHAVAAVAALPPYWWRLRRKVVALGATVLHTGEQRGALLAGPAARLAGVPLVWQIHSLEASRAIAWIASLLATTVVVPSSSTSAAVGRLPRRPVVVPNPVVAPPPVTDQLATGDRSPDRPVVLTCGRLHPVKGYDVLFDAVTILIERQRQLHVVVRGDRQLGHEAHAHALVERLGNDGLTDVVEFADFGEHPFMTGRGAAVYVQPSRHETFGLAAAEAMAAGLPVVASDVGGLAELVDHGRTGLLVPPGDATALADAIDRLLDDRALAARLAAAGQAEVAARFGRGVEAMAVVYERAASRRRPGRWLSQDGHPPMRRRSS